MRPVRDIQRELDAIDQRRAALERELSAAERIPPEPDQGVIVKFHAQFTGADPVNRFIAMHFPEAWVLIAPDGSAIHHTWESLVAVMRRDVAVEAGVKKLTYQVVKKWETATWP